MHPSKKGLCNQYHAISQIVSLALPQTTARLVVKVLEPNQENVFPALINAKAVMKITALNAMKDTMLTMESAGQTQQMDSGRSVQTHIAIIV